MTELRRNKNRVPVFVLNSALDIPAQHYASRTLASLLISYPLAWPVLGGAALQLLTAEPWVDVKDRFRAVRHGLRPIPKILPPCTPMPLMLTYPPTHQESDGRQRQAELWMRATKF